MTKKTITTPITRRVTVFIVLTTILRTKTHDQIHPSLSQSTNAFIFAEYQRI